ncbi:MAG: hypothetical protein ACRC0V_05745 [Fusobacteriaceae bacterium]
MKELLIKLNACNEAIKWAKDKTWEEIYKTCPRGDWLLWLFARTNPNDVQLMLLAKGHCANTVRHLMEDPRSIAAVDAAIAFGEGKITEEKLKSYDDAAYAAYNDATAYYATTAGAATAAANYAATAAAVNAYTAYAAYTYADAKAKNQLKTANICRTYLPIKIWNINI